jgi:fibro-slime domain-containing protein
MRWDLALALPIAVAMGCGSGTRDGFVFDTEPASDEKPAEPAPPATSSGSFAPSDVPKPSCGDGVKADKEACDDGNTKPGDGCSATCTIEAGWKCPVPAAACIAAKCGDGIVAGDEDCDDGNASDGDGCSATCILEQGFKCDAPGKPCTPTVCGDGKKEGTEHCDDGNTRPYDGCSPTCTLEPKCTGGTCTALCGDGVKFPGEECDDGNTKSGDGCSATCKLEPGFDCSVKTSDLPSSIDVPIVYRDFKDTHPDFESWCCALTPGIASSTIGSNGVPSLLGVGSPQMVTNATSFGQWYVDTSGVNVAIAEALTLVKQTDGSYVYDNASFFPLDGKGFGNQGREHNFHFTSELRYWFTWKGGEVLDFRGDDDVFVFVNGKLAVDLGGVHGAEAGSVTLDASKAASLGLVVDQLYELDVFQAERHTTASNYKLTIRGFQKRRRRARPFAATRSRRSTKRATTATRSRATAAPLRARSRRRRRSSFSLFFPSSREEEREPARRDDAEREGERDGDDHRRRSARPHHHRRRGPHHVCAMDVDLRRDHHGQRRWRRSPFEGTRRRHGRAPEDHGVLLHRLGAGGRRSERRRCERGRDRDRIRVRRNRWCGGERDA